MTNSTITNSVLRLPLPAVFIGLILFVLLGLTSCGDSGTQTSEQLQSSESAAGANVVEPVADMSPIATTQYGDVRGFTEDGINVFKGIRYGADTATTRFQPPRTPESWSGVQDALVYGNSTRQIPTGTGGGLFTSWRGNPAPELSEDCLFLNVWTPGVRDGEKRPVLVWFHGGGFSSGSGSSLVYDGVRLANRGDVVIVTVNHRLNYFGYMYLAEYGDQFADSGNAGMLDLVQSLEWVRDNISEFGGDPGNVLIFGESGGGFKVSNLMAMDDAKGLFHRAVVQSGPTIESATTQDAAKATAAVIEKLGLTRQTIDQILSMPAEDIELAARSVARELNLSPGRGPVVDGRALKRHPFLSDAPPHSIDVPLLIGTTRTENSLLIGARNPDLFDLTWEALPDALMPYIDDLDVMKIISTYRGLHPEIDAAELFFTATTDARFLNRSIEMADKKSAQSGANTWFYMLNWDTPVDGGKWLVPHASEIGMVFDNVAKSESMSGTGKEPQRIADLMSEAWIAFARVGNPNHDGLPDWPAFNSGTRATMIFDLEPKVIDDPHGIQRRLFLDSE